MSVYVLQRECLDYYCGCGGGHIVGVFTTPPEVPDRLIETVTEVPLNTARWVDSPGRDVGYRGDYDPNHGWT